jgi:AcrR family transcriptional regulator
MTTNLAIGGRRLTRRGRQRKAELLEAAISLFSDLGFEGTTTKAIAERSGVTEAVIFRYFETKQDLFREVVEVYGPLLHYEMPFEDLRDSPFEVALGKLLEGYLEHAWKHRRSIRLFLLATFHDDEIRGRLGHFFEYRRRRVHEMLAERVSAGEVCADALEYGAEIITLATTGFLVRSLRQEPKDWLQARDQFRRHLAATVTRGLLVEPPVMPGSK